MRLLANFGSRSKANSRGAAWQAYVKAVKPHDNGQYKNLRFEDVWLDK